MRIKNLFKYLFRFLSLQIILTLITIYYFDNFLIWDESFKYEIYLNLIEDKNRFFPFVDDIFITVDGVLILLIFVFLIIIYSTNFYTYVLIPVILMIFRNTEFISSLLGRAVTNETYISFNLDDNSKFRNLRIMTFRKNLGSYFINENNTEKEIIEIFDKENKLKKINLVIINSNLNKISENLEKYLINLNKKVLIISDKKIEFKNNFLYREEIIDGYRLVYFNNDIQYGSKFIIKRILDITLSLILLVLFSPFIIFISILIFVKDGLPIVIKQDRVGLHGEQFSMFKFRSMKNDSHELRKELSNLNKRKGPLFKIQNDPRILSGLNFIREMSLDEIPQLLNVLRGEMSIVGPRPLFDDDTKMFDTNYMRRLNVMPGITGLLQINERNAVDFKTWYKYDIEYIENWSLFLDLEIILKTPFAMFSKKIRGI